MEISTDATLHLDGFRVIPESSDDKVKAVIRLVVGGKSAPEIFPELVLFEAPRDNSSEAALEQAMILGQAMCSYVNSGGSRDSMFLLTDKFIQAVPDIVPRHTLVSVLPPPGGLVTVWKRTDGSYLRIQEGEEGFSEVLTEEQVQAFTADMARGDDDWVS